jgi:hypothetical protein
LWLEYLKQLQQNSILTFKILKLYFLDVSFNSLANNIERVKFFSFTS